MLSTQLHAMRRMASTAGSARLVLGAGSNVMDLFYPTRKLPMPGEKQYFALEKILANSVVGGVTLNHLAWARALGVPTGLLAFQGTDANGQAIRAKLKEMDMSTEFVRVSDAYSTSVSFVFNDPSGERTIIMAPASTSQMTGGKMAKEFASVAERAAMITSEISQLPLSGVQFLCDTAKRAKVPSLIDVDVTPSVAVGPAQLGNLDELRRCLQSADVLKFTASAAEESLALVSKDKLASDLEGMTAQLADAFGAKVCVMTDGSRGAALALGCAYHQALAGSARPTVTVSAYPGVKQKDATGAGDAFFGGIVAAFFKYGLPKSKDDLTRAGRIASAAGAACVEVEGALPVASVSPKRMLELSRECEPLIHAGARADVQVGEAPAPAPTPLTAHALTSIAADAHTLRSMHDTYQRSAIAVQDNLKLLIAEVTRCRASGSGPSGHVYVSGLGKSGAVAARFAISLRSIGFAASYVHGTEWFHGDLGTLRSGDCLISLSHSGTTAELLDVSQRARARGVFTFAITGFADSPLAKTCHASMTAPVSPDAPELLGKVPSRSIVAQEAAVNVCVHALTLSVGLTQEQFKENHPGGALGGAR